MNFKTILVACAVVFAASSAQAAVTSRGDVADGWFMANGDFSSFTIGNTPGDGYLRTFGASYARSALEFSLAGIASGSVINSATFSIISGGTAMAGGDFQFWGYAGDGIITDSDATQKFNLIGTTPTLSGTPTYTINLTSFIQSLVNSHSSYAGILITVAQEGPGTFLGNDLISGQRGSFYGYTEDYLPKLTLDVSPVPEPSSAAMLGIGLLGLAAFSRRKQRS